MTPNLLNLTAIAFYVITWVLITRSVQASIKATDTSQEKRSSSSKLYFVTWGVALTDHVFIIITPLTNSDGLSFSFVALVSYVNVVYQFDFIYFHAESKNSSTGGGDFTFYDT